MNAVQKLPTHPLHTDSLRSTLRRLNSIPTENVFLTKWLPLLPQVQRINLEDAARWRNDVIDMDPNRFAWHFRRLSGIGGSEIGEIAMSSQGMTNTFKSPYQMAAEKLMVASPEPPNALMLRGIYMEPVIQNYFLAQYGAKTLALLGEINKAESSLYPWMSGNADDVVDIARNIYLIDYKAPTEAEVQSQLTYAAQLHIYDYLLAIAQGPHNDGEPLVSGPLGCNGLLNVKLDYDKWNLVVTEIPHSIELLEACLSGGNEFWNHIVNGVPLPSNWKSKIRVAVGFDAMPEPLKETADILENRCLTAKLVAKEADDQAKKAETELLGVYRQAAGGDVLLAGSKVPTQMLSLGSRLSVDGEKMDGILSSAQADEQIIDTLKKLPSGKLDTEKAQEFIAQHAPSLGYDLVYFEKRDYDPERVSAWCEAQGIDPPLKETLWFETGRKKNIKELVAQARNAVNPAVNALIDGFCHDEEDLEIPLLN